MYVAIVSQLVLNNVLLSRPLSNQHVEFLRWIFRCLVCSIFICKWLITMSIEQYLSFCGMGASFSTEASGSTLRGRTVKILMFKMGHYNAIRFFNVLMVS
jgi:hypothetical protein